MNYRQCRLRKSLPSGGWLEDISFIPEIYATTGGRIRVKDRHGAWDRGWEVADVWDERSEDSLGDSHRDIRAHRRRTGDSLPRYDCDA
jgi:hypothetical protein